jgi:hypothetical protein
MDEQGQRIPNCRAIICPKLAVNVDFFTARSKAQSSSNVHNVNQEIETLSQLGIFY